MYSFLLIDDEVIIRDGVRDNIDWARHGYTFLGACADGRAGIEAIDTLRPDVVLTDICMPFVDGLDLARYVRDRYPSTKVILLTGYEEFEYAQEAVKLKVDDFILKPITADELRVLLDSLREQLDAEAKRLRDLDRLRVQLKESLPLLRERVLNRLVEGGVEEDEIGSRLEECGLSLPGPLYLTMVIDLDGSGSEGVAADGELLRLAVKNIAEERLDAGVGSSDASTDGRAASDGERASDGGSSGASHGSQAAGAGVVVGEGGARAAASTGFAGAVTFQNASAQVVVLCSAADREALERESLRAAEEIRDRVSSSLGLSVSAGVGRTVAGLSGVGRAYREALAALDYRLVAGRNQVITFEAIAAPGSNEGPDPAEVGRRLAAAIRTSTVDEMERLVDELAAALARRTPSSSASITVIETTLAFIIASLSELGVPESEVAPKERQGSLFVAVSRLTTLGEITDWLKGLCRRAGEAIERRREDLSRVKAAAAEEYIRAHYGRPALSLSDVCRATGTSTSHFCTLFKKHTDKTFVEYLTELRIEKAKELFRSSDLRSYEIAESVGYTDPHYFSLIFKKITGSSPSAYREKHAGKR